MDFYRLDPCAASRALLEAVTGPGDFVETVPAYNPNIEIGDGIVLATWDGVGTGTIIAHGLVEAKRGSEVEIIWRAVQAYPVDLTFGGCMQWRNLQITFKFKPARSGRYGFEQRFRMTFADRL